MKYKNFFSTTFKSDLQYKQKYFEKWAIFFKLYFLFSIRFHLNLLYFKFILVLKLSHLLYFKMKFKLTSYLLKKITNYSNWNSKYLRKCIYLITSDIVLIHSFEIKRILTKIFNPHTWIRKQIKVSLKIFNSWFMKLLFTKSALFKRLYFLSYIDECRVLDSYKIFILGV